jgi:hypothetical protein
MKTRQREDEYLVYEIRIDFTLNGKLDYGIFVSSTQADQAKSGNINDLLTRGVVFNIYDYIDRQATVNAATLNVFARTFRNSEVKNLKGLVKTNNKYMGTVRGKEGN